MSERKWYLIPMKGGGFRDMYTQETIIPVGDNGVAGSEAILTVANAMKPLDQSLNEFLRGAAKDEKKT